MCSFCVTPEYLLHAPTPSGNQLNPLATGLAETHTAVCSLAPFFIIQIGSGSMLLTGLFVESLSVQVKDTHTATCFVHVPTLPYSLGNTRKILCRQLSKAVRVLLYRMYVASRAERLHASNSSLAGANMRGPEPLEREWGAALEAGPTAHRGHLYESRCSLRLGAGACTRADPCRTRC